VVVGFIIFVIIDSRNANHVRRLTTEFLQWVVDNLWAGVFSFIGVYFLATLLFIPGSLLTLGAGFVFASALGLGWGVLLASIAVFVGATSGATAAFLLGRYLVRDSIKHVSEKYPVFQAIDAALEHNGFRIVILLRLSPLIPFNAINYILGVTAVPFRDYVLACFAMLPGTVIFVFLGSSAGSLVDSATSGNDNRVLTISVIVAGVVFGLGGLTVITYYAKKELQRIVQENEERDGDAEEGQNNLVVDSYQHQEEVQEILGCTTLVQAK